MWWYFGNSFIKLYGHRYMILCLPCLSLSVWYWMFAFDVLIGDVPSWPVRFMPRPRSNVIIAIRPIPARLDVHTYEAARGIIVRTFCLWRAIPDQETSVHYSDMCSPTTSLARPYWGCLSLMDDRVSRQSSQSFMRQSDWSSLPAILQSLLHESST